MKKIIIWRKVSSRQKINPRKLWNDVEGKNLLYSDYLETLECGHSTTVFCVLAEPKAARRGCDECRKPVLRDQQQASEKRSAEVSRQREIEMLEKHVADRLTFPELVEEYFRDIKTMVARAEDAWRRRANLSDSERGRATHDALKDAKGYNSLETLASGLENALDSMRQGHDRQKDRLEDEAKLKKLRGDACPSS